MNPQLSPDIQSQLELLRDIRLPEPIGWWPLAPGWWIAATLCLALIAGTVLWSYLRRRTVRFAALRELDALRIADGPTDMAHYATEISALLRRVAIRANGRAAGLLSGTEWSDFLSNGKGGMERHWSTVLAEAPYSPSHLAETDEIRALADAAELWIRRHA
ncbi:MAG: DUF4381 domain-containing protein [Alphaproteobacteria bacterium]|nr:DUF4381 domain-containing protein [Alphaproteobacteria bacterium]